MTRSTFVESQLSTKPSRIDFFPTHLISFTTAETVKRIYPFSVLRKTLQEENALKKTRLYSSKRFVTKLRIVIFFVALPSPSGGSFHLDQISRRNNPAKRPCKVFLAAGLT